MKKVLVVLSAILIASCSVEDGKDGVNGTDGINGVDGLNGYSSLIVVLEDNSVCPTGGMKVETGLDVNEDGVLNPSEVTSTTYICNGQDGTNGTNGSDGQDGQDGQDGSDANSNFIFTSEVVSGDFCNSDGGVLFSYGFDTNTNGQLDPSEVVNTALVCDGSDGETGATGSQGDSGQDGADGQDGSNGSDGQDGQNGSNGADGSNGYNALVSIDYVEEGELCEFGGISVSFGLDLNLNGELDQEEITGTDITCFTGPIDPTPDPFDVVFHGEWVVYSYKPVGASQAVVVTEYAEEPDIVIDYGIIPLPDSGSIKLNEEDWGWTIYSQSNTDPVQVYNIKVTGYNNYTVNLNYRIADYQNNNLPETLYWSANKTFGEYTGSAFTFVRLPQN